MPHSQLSNYPPRAYSNWKESLFSRTTYTFRGQTRIIIEFLLKGQWNQPPSERNTHRVNTPFVRSVSKHDVIIIKYIVFDRRCINVFYPTGFTQYTYIILHNYYIGIYYYVDPPALISCEWTPRCRGDFKILWSANFVQLSLCHPARLLFARRDGEW